MKNFKRILCIDIGGTFTKHCIASGRSLSTLKKESTVREKGFFPFINGVISSYKEDSYDCVSIGFCGLVLDTNYLYSENLGVINKPVSNIRSKKQLYIANDVFCSSLTALSRKDIKSKQIVYVMIGTSIAVALVNKGDIVTGQNNMFGEVMDIDLELGNNFLKQKGLEDFLFTTKPTTQTYKDYLSKTKQLISVITAILAPHEIIFSGGVVIHHWNQPLRDELIQHTNNLFKYARPKLVFAKRYNFDNIKGVSMLPSYLEHAKNNPFPA